MNSPALLVLAAGLGSRYGGIKQMDPVGPDGEFVLDYSVYDAWMSGFDHVVFVIRPELEGPLREHFGAKLSGRLKTTYVYQDLADLPTGFTLPHERRKPWGTGHAIWSARQAIKQPFGVINADDFYGRNAYGVLADFLRSQCCDETTYCMVGYRLANTLSEHGTVARGICTRSPDGFLLDVVERTDIEKFGNGARCRVEDSNWQLLTGNESVSLNLWGFTPTLFASLEDLFGEFLQSQIDEYKAEFFIPTVVDTLIKRKLCRTALLSTDERWFGMTYKEDRALVVGNIARLINEGVYPEHLWG